MPTAPFLPGLAELWAETMGDPEIRVAILDGPVDATHPCFAGASIERLPTLVSDEAAPGQTMSVHGTHVASIIVGQHQGPVAGIAPACHGLILPVFREDRRGHLSQLDLARAIEQAVEAGAHVINVSGGEYTPTPHADDALVRAIGFCERSNVLVVAAAGNDGCECLHVPAALPACAPWVPSAMTGCRCQAATGARSIAIMASWPPARTFPVRCRVQP